MLDEEAPLSSRQMSHRAHSHRDGLVSFVHSDALPVLEEPTREASLQIPAAKQEAEVNAWLRETFTSDKRGKRGVSEQSEARTISFGGMGRSTVTPNEQGIAAASRSSPRGHRQSLLIAQGSMGFSVLPPKASEPRGVPPSDGERRVEIFEQANVVCSVAVGDVSEHGVEESITLPAPDFEEQKYRRATARQSTAYAANYAATLASADIPLLEVDSPDFNIFEAASLAESLGRPPEDSFLFVSCNVLFRYSFLETYGICIPKLVHFLKSIADCYSSVNPYHNALHAADVLQTAHVYLCQSDVRSNFNDLELFVLLFSALIHDVGHLGVGNGFLVAVQHPISELYACGSPLESMHVALAFQVLDAPANNFLAESEKWSTELNHTFRELVAEVVLGTDMKFHMSTIGNVQEILADGVIEDSEMGRLLKAILHLADLSNPLKPLDVYKNWVDRVMAEMWQQGDQERRRSLPVSKMCDRDQTAIAKAQAGFIQFIVQPLAMELSTLLPEVWMKRLEGNLEYMQNLSRTAEYDVSGIVQLSATPWVDTWYGTPFVELVRSGLCTDPQSPPEEQQPLGPPSAVPSAEMAELVAHVSAVFSRVLVVQAERLEETPCLTNLQLFELSKGFALAMSAKLRELQDIFEMESSPFHKQQPWFITDILHTLSFFADAAAPSTPAVSGSSEDSGSKQRSRREAVASQRAVTLVETLAKEPVSSTCRNINRDALAVPSTRSYNPLKAHLANLCRAWWAMTQTAKARISAPMVPLHSPGISPTHGGRDADASVTSISDCVILGAPPLRH